MNEGKRSIVFSVLAAFSILAVGVSAVFADGRPGSEADLNDGGAWLLNRSEASLGHVNRVVREISSVAGPFSGPFEVSQSASVVVVNNRGAGQAVLVDTGLAQPGATVTIGDSVEVFAAPRAVVLVDRLVGSAWRFKREEFAALESIDGQTPHLELGAESLATVGRDGLVAMIDKVDGVVSLLDLEGNTTTTEIEGLSGDPIDITMVGSTVVALVDGETLVATDDGDEVVYRLPVELAVLQQPAMDGNSVTGVSLGGEVVTVDLESGDIDTVEVDGSNPIEPIVHRGCTWLITRDPNPVLHYCGQSYQLPSGATELTLSLVNDWVWVNDVNQGGIWFVREDDLEVEEVSQWEAALKTNDEVENTDDGSGDEELIEDPTTSELGEEVDELDEDERNEPPVAVDDSYASRRGRTVLLPVLNNDSDPDNDPLSVESITGVDAGGFTGNGVKVQIQPGGIGLQMIPPPDFVGTVRFGYVVHDGRGGKDEAEVEVTVGELTEVGNQEPKAEVDNATVRAGRSVSLNVLTNDVDPDGDALLLVSVAASGGDITFAPDGEVSYSPDVTSPDGEVELEYEVADGFGAVTTGVARIRVRQADSNQAPQARNDVAATAVGRPAVINVLDNDADPDGDPLVAQSLQGMDGIVTDALLTPNGRFVFTPEEPGVYRFTYAVNDGPEIDEAQIRVDVRPDDDNLPPVAMLDEVKLAVGETRLIHVLANDGDPDGDVIGIIDWVGAEGLEIDEVPGVGFSIQALESAVDTAIFGYWISDGINEPVRGEVAVSALNRPPVDYRPVAVADSFDVRPGNTAALAVLRNDFDPEGRLLTISEPVAELDEGTLRVSGDGQQLLLKVDEDQQFGFQFSYDVEDPAGNRASAVVNIRLVRNQPNRPPVAVPDREWTPAGTEIAVSVLDNDYDPDSDSILVESIASQPTNGRAEVLEDGTILYTPNSGFAGTDSFAYTVVDGFQPDPSTTSEDGATVGPGRDLGQVYVGVMSDQPANRPPVAIDDPDLAQVELGSGPVILAVLANDSDPDADPIRITGVSTAGVGDVRVLGGGALEYTPPSDGDSRSLAFTYTIADGRGGEDSAEVTIELVSDVEPQPPVAFDDQIGPSTVGAVIPFDPRINDRDPDGNVEDLEVISLSSNMSVNPDGTVNIVTPPSTGDVLYQVRDAQGLESDPAVITVLVQNNEPPSVDPISVETEFETPIEIDLHSTATDPDGDPLKLTLGSRQFGGAVQVVGQPTSDFLRVRFSPDSGFDGTASFEYLVDDRNGHLVAATAQIEVLPQENQPPTASPISIDGEAGIDVVVRLSEGVTDPDENGADAHLYSIGSAGGNGIEVVGPNSANEVTVRSPIDAGETRLSFDYTVQDGEFSETSTVTVSLSPAGFPAPVTNLDFDRVLQGEIPDPILVLANDVDQSPTGLAGGGLIVTSVGVTPAGQTSFDDSSVSFVPDADFFGTATFTYTVQDGRRVAEGESTGTVKVEVVGRPATPQPPVVEEVGNGYVVLSWGPPQADNSRGVVSGYELRYQAGGSSDSIVFDQPSTGYRWQGLTNGVLHCFSVAAINEAGQGEFSDSPGNAECGVPDTRPEPIQAPPTVDFGDRELKVSWVEPQNQGSPIVNYQVRMGGGAQALSSELGVSLEHTWTGLTNGTDYTFQVRSQNGALDNDGWSDWSPISAPEHPLTGPDAPARPGAERGDQQVQVTWSEPYNGGDPVTEYQIRSSLNPTWVSVVSQGVTNRYTWEAIPNGTTVSFQVKAINRDPLSVNPGDVSPNSPAVTPCAVPDAPGRPQVSPGDTFVTVSWDAPNDQGCAITDYRITASNGSTQTASASSRSLRFDGLTNGTSYTFTVAARNEVVTQDGAAPVNSAASASVVPFGVPRAPGNVSASNISRRQVRLSWSRADNNGNAISRYEIQTNGGAWTSVGNVTLVELPVGSDGTSYDYRVRAVNAAGAGDASSLASVTTWSVPGRPSVAVSSSSTSEIRASWTPPSNGGTSLTGHEASISTNNSCGGNTRTNPGSPETWGSLSSGTSYRVCVRYSNEVGWGEWGSGNATTTMLSPSVTISKGAPTGVDGCYTAPCARVNVTLNHFPGGEKTVYCYSDLSSDPYWNYVAGSGNYCVYGYPGRPVWVVVDGVRSNTLTW